MEFSFEDLSPETLKTLDNEVELFSAEILSLLEEPKTNFCEALNDILHRAGLSCNFDCDITFHVAISPSTDQPEVEETFN